MIVILTDDQGYADVGFNGSTDIPTPNIDRIAAEGVRFDRGYVSFPVCSPSRAGLLTGRYQSRFGFDLNPSLNPLDPAAGLPLSERTLADQLRSVGYTSAAIGKWHLGTHSQFHPMRRGFDEFYGFLAGGHTYFLDRLLPIPNSEAQSSRDLYNNWLMEGTEHVESSGYITDWLSAKAVDFVERRRATPFFLYLAYNAPHEPMQATQKYLDRFAHIQDEGRRTYAAMISAVDDGVGEVLKKLDELGLAEHTLVIFLSDNGGSLHAQGLAASNLPLRGGKGQMFEGGIRVPFAMRWTGRLPAGMNYALPVSSLDIVPTALALSGATAPTDRKLDGVDLVPFLLGERPGQMPHGQLFWRYPRNTRDNTQIWKLGVISGSAKLVHHNTPDRPARFLFDLSSDVSEANDLLDSNPARAAELEQAWHVWNSQMAEESAISIFSEWP